MDWKKVLEDLQTQRAALYDSIKKAATNEEVDKIELDLRKLDIQIKEAEEHIQNNDGEDPATRNDNPELTGGEHEVRNFNPLGTFRSNSGQQQQRNNLEDDGDIFSSMEYRMAFRNYIVSGTPIPEKFRNAAKEERSNELTMVGDVAAVIPTTISNKVIEDITVEGKILSRITQTSYQGGVDIPISEIMPEATWLESEDEVSDEQKAKMKAKLSFGYHMLEARVSIGLLSATVSLGVFEQTIVKNLKKAMIRAIEKAIVEGTGSGQPLGITKYSNLPDENIVEMDASQVGTVAGWASVEAAIPEAYEANGIYIMSKKTWEKYLNGMTDSVGQRIGLGKINEKGQKILNGREVLTTDRLKGFDNANDGDIIGVVVDLEQYILNSNLAMYYKKYFDEDKNKYVHKSLMIADGKMAIGEITDGGSTKLIGAGSLIYIKKKVSE